MSESNEIVLTELDHDRLWRLVERARNNEAVTDLETELERAIVVRPQELPPDVVSMNSRVELEDLETCERMVISVVFPGESAPSKGRISVLAPMGTALLGCRADEVLEWRMPGGPRRLRVARVLYQPEAEGRFDR